MQLASLILLLACAQPSLAFFILRHATLLRTRLDPIVNPGIVAQHEHNIVGGSRFGRDYDYDDLLSSSCTTSPVSIDKSNYWAPQLYYYEPVKKTYEAIPSYSNTYYLQRPGSKNEKIQAFPKGLQMVAGKAGRRTFNASSFEDQAVSFVCLDYYNDHTGDKAWEQRNNFFEHNCPDGMRAQVFFPSCWDGKNLYKPDQSHMAYPVDTFQGGNCPSTHPVHLISLFYEWVFTVGDFPFNAPGTPTWVFANGDTTGYGFHADFTMGWPTGPNSVLQQAIDTCGLETGGDVNACAVFAPHMDNNAAAACKPEGQVVDEPNGWKSPITKLPGNNPMWSGLSTTKPSTPGYVEAATYTIAGSSIPSGWNKVGCIAEGSVGRALAAASTTSPTMSVASCIAFCANLGLPLAGTEWGVECYCDSAFRNGASDATLTDDLCSTSCGGEPDENCGGSSKLTVYRNSAPDAKPVLASGWAAHSSPCMTDAGSTRSLTGAFTSSASMTVPMCVAFCESKGFLYAGLEYASECYCGSKWTSGTQAATEGSCNMPCAGKISQTCGGSNRLSVYAKVSSSTSTSVSVSAPAASDTSASLPSGWQTQGCVIDGSPRLLSGSYTSLKTTNTPAACIAACAAGGFSYAGTQNGDQCYCGSTLNASGKIGTTAADSYCQAAACPGDASQKCGGPFYMRLFKSSPVAAPSSSSAPAPTASGTATSVPSGWQSKGCVNDGSARLLTGLAPSLGSGNTPAACIAACAAKGFTYAGVEYGIECYCGSTLNAAGGVGTPAADADCQAVSCSGDPSQKCGGAYRMRLWQALTGADTPLPSGWSAQGCVGDGSARLLTGSYTSLRTTNTPAACIAACAAGGFNYAGVQNGDQCYCGSTLNASGSVGAALADSACQAVACPGDESQKCGGAWRMRLFKADAGSAPSRRALGRRTHKQRRSRSNRH